MPASARLDVDNDGTPDPAVVGPAAHAGYCALWAKQRETTSGLLNSVATATDLIDDLTPLLPASRSRSLRELMPLVDLYNGTVNGSHVPNFRTPWSDTCTSGGGAVDNGQRFAVRMRGNLHIEAAGTYTFLFNSDDGYLFTIGGQTVATYNGNRSPAFDSRRVTFAQPGVYPSELIYWDQAGQSVMEIFLRQGSICFDSNKNQNTCSTSGFSDLSSSGVPASIPTGFVTLGSDRVDPASWSTDPLDTCAPYVGQPNTMCTPSSGGCGNGLVEALADGGVEGCDDGNTTPGDGCSASCTVETSYTCGTPQISICRPVAPVITAPTSGANLNTTTPTLSGTGSPGMTVTVSVDGAQVCTATVTAAGTWTCTSSALAQGAHSATATQTDAGGRTSAASTAVPFTVDTIAPAAPVITTPLQNAVTSDSTPTVGGTAEAGSTVRVFIDGSGTPACTTVASVTGAWSCDVSPALADGAHLARATATDAANNTSGLSAARTFTVDTVAPVAPVVSAPANGSVTANNRPPVSGTAEAGTTVTVFFDGTTTVACTATATALGTWTCTPTAALADGAHAVRAVSTDAAGNATSSSSNTFRVDTTPPAAPVVVAPATGSVTSQRRPTYSGTAEAGSTVTVLVDGATACTTTASASGAWSCGQPTDLSDGAHTVRASATDAAGNASVPSNTNTFTVDTVAPVAPVITAPTANSTTGDPTPTLSGTAEPGATVTVRVDGAVVCTATTTAGGTWTCTSSTLSDGAHTATATATDAAGNTSPTSTAVPFTIDSTPPAAPVVTAPSNGSRTNDTTPTVSGTAEAGSSVKVFFDGSTTAACTATTSASGSWTCTPTTALAEGSHTVRATATDSANNTSAQSAANTFTIDTTAPGAPVVTAPANGSRTNDTTPTVSGTAEAGSTVKIFFDGSTTVACTATADASGAWTCTPTAALAQGQHQVRATATDVAGNPSAQSAANTFTVDTTAPVAPVVTAPADGSTTADATPTVSGTAEANATVRVFLDGSATPACTATASATGAWSCDVTAALADGPHTVTATAIDQAGNTSPASSPNSFTVDTAAPSAPVVTAPADGSATNDATPTVSGTAEANSTVSVFFDGSTTAACTATADATGAWSCDATTALTAGSHTVRASARDAGGNTSALSNANAFTVDLTAPVAPVVTAPTNGASLADTSPLVSGTAEPGSTVTVFVDGSTTPACSAAVDASGSWSCEIAPALAEGSHTLVARATDDAGNVSPDSTQVAFTIDVSGPSAPVVTAPAAGSSIGDATPTISGTAEPGAQISVFLDGATMAACTATTAVDGTWSCDVTSPLVDGPHTVFATATDGAGNSATGATTTFTVDTAAPATPVILAPQANATTSATPTFSGTAEAGSTVTVSVDGAQVCTAVTSSTGSFACVASTPLTTGAHAATAVATDEAGNRSGPSASVPFTVGSTEPPGPPVIATPADGSSTNDPTPTVTGTAAPGSTVRVFADGSMTPACTATADAMGAFSCDVAPALADGQHTLVATASTSAGTSLPSAPVTFTVDTVAPVDPVVLTPADGSTTSTTPFVTGTAEPGSTVAIFIDGQVAPVCLTTADASGAFACLVTVGVGQHTVGAIATDRAGNNATSDLNTFTAATGQPLDPPVITSPAHDAVVNDSTPELSGLSVPNTQVSVFVDGQTTAACTAVTDASGHFACSPSTPLSEGAHTVSAVATDGTLVSMASGSVPFTVDTVAPMAPVITSPTTGASTGRTPTVTGTAEPGSTVVVRIDGQVVCQTTADTTGAWSCPVTQPLPPGAHEVMAAAVDPAGNVSPQSTPVSFTVLDTPRTPVLDTPANGSELTDTTPTYSGLAEPGSQVTVTVDGADVCTVTADAGGAFTCTPTEPLALGMHSVTVSSTSAGGSATSMPSSFTLVPPRPDAPVITAPVEGSTTGDATPTFSGTATPGSTVSVKVDGTEVCTATTDSSGRWSCDATAPLSASSHTATATQTTADGTSEASTPVHFGVSATAPVITSPQPGDEAGTQPTFTGTAQPGSTVTIEIDGQAVCTTTADAQGQFSCTPTQPLPAGNVTVTARSVDEFGIERTSDSLTFRVVAYKLGGGSLIGCSTSGEGALVLMLVALLARRRRLWPSA